jgi:CRP/FNR family nitrogen fixation transcriptional regulator
MSVAAHPVRTTPHLAASTLRATDAKSALSSFGTVSHFSRHNTIFGEGDDAKYSYHVVTGAVRLSKMMPDGRRQIAEFDLPGDFFGINWLQEHALTAEALTDVTLICYGRGRLERLGEENREVRGELFSTLRHDLWAAQNHLMILGRQSANERVASFLVQLMERGKHADKRSINIPMSRQDVADYLGLTIETVCRVLSKLRQSRVIDLPSRHEIVVRNTEALRRAAQPEEQN